MGAAIELNTLFAAVPEAAVELSVNVDVEIERYLPVVDGVDETAFEISNKPAGH